MTATGNRGFWPLRDLPVLFWLAATAVVALIHPFVPAPRWLMLHFLLLGAATHAILVWSRYFSDAVLHAAGEDRRRQGRRLLLLNAGVVTVVVGVAAEITAVTTAGALGVASAVGWHGWSLARDLRVAFPARFTGTVHHYVAAACFLPLGAALGVVLSSGLADPWHTRVLLGHVTINLLGWIGLTVVGTLLTLWPTMLRTRIAEGAERAARRALPVLAGSVVVTAGAALAGSRIVAAVGVAAYVGGLVLVVPGLLDAARRKPPSSFPAWSVLAGLCWWVGGLATVAVTTGTATSWAEAGSRLGELTPFLAAGFAAQVLLGALSYLVPVALGGGPTPVRAGNRVLDRAGPARLVVTNAGLLLCLLPTPSLVRVLASTLVLVSLGATLPLMLMAVRAARVAKGTPAPERAAPPTDRPAGQRAGLAVSGLTAAVLVVAVGVALDPAALGAGSTASAAAGVAATGRTTTVEVSAKDMRFTPAKVSVPAGNRLVIVLTNADSGEVHDLVLDSGARSGRLAPGDSTRVDVGVVGRSLDGWCSVIGHRQMGMVFQVAVTGSAQVAGAEASGGGHGGHQHGPTADHEPTGEATSPVEPSPKDPSGRTAHDATLPPLGTSTVRRHTFVVQDVVTEVAPGVTQRLWTYNGSAPGPTLHGRVGDTFVITLVNKGSMGHSIDFHAGALAPQQPMRTIAPGETLTYRFRALRSGVWMYHCSTMPMSAHIANGLYGAVVVEPRGLPPADRTYLLVQSEHYLGPDGGEVDMDKVLRERPDAVVFNGYPDQYDASPLAAKVGERVRIWVLDAGPNRPTSFHVVGGQFDTVYSEGAYLLRRGTGGAQSLGLHPAQGGFVELAFPEPGDYPFVSHVMVDAERGAHGLFRVTR